MPVLLGFCLETELRLRCQIRVRYLCLNKLFPLPKFSQFNGLELEFNSSTFFAHVFLHCDCVEMGNLTWNGKAHPVT